MSVLDLAWQDFLAASWPQLAARGRVCAPPDLPHPSVSGFERPWIAEPAGQVADWTVSLADGSRLHAHEYGDGGLVVHRDALDPAQGLGRAAGHVVCETSIGRAVALVALGTLLALGLTHLGIGFRRVPLERLVTA